MAILKNPLLVVALVLSALAAQSALAKEVSCSNDRFYIRLKYSGAQVSEVTFRDMSHGDDFEIFAYSNIPPEAQYQMSFRQEYNAQSGVRHITWGSSDEGYGSDLDFKIGYANGAYRLTDVRASTTVERDEDDLVATVAEIPNCREI